VYNNNNNIILLQYERRFEEADGANLDVYVCRIVSIIYLACGRDDVRQNTRGKSKSERSAAVGV